MRLFFILSLILATALHASPRTIKGTVISETDSTGVAGAVCQLTADGRTLEAVATDYAGNFLLRTDTSGVLDLAVSMTGYNVTSVIIESGKKNLELGNIYLSEGTELQGVTVTGHQVMDVKGRTVIFPGGADVKSSSTALSLFGKLPLAGLDADPVNRTLRIDGGAPMILIDGIPASMNDFNTLQPKDIQKIEYSRITPARYADKGTQGLISITLRKRDDGGSIYLWGRSATATAFMDGNMRMSYHQGPSQFSFSYNPSWRNYKKVFDSSEESYIGDDFRVDLTTNDRNPFNYLSNPLQLKYNLRPDDRTLFSATFRADIFTDKRAVYGETTDSQLGDYLLDNNSHSKKVTPALDLFLHRDFNSSNSLEIQVVGTLGSDRYFRENRYLLYSGETDIYETDVKSRRRSLISEISYIHNFSERTSLSAGFQNTVSHSRNIYRDTDYEPVLTENNNYVYAGLGHQFGRVYLWASTGAKLFWIRNDLNKRHFIRNLTTVQANWNIGHGWQLNAAFQYTPLIPGLTSLTDYPQQTSPYLVSNGNPDLKVAENFYYQLSPSFNYRKINTSLFLSFNNVRNGVINDMIYMGDKRFLSMSVNARRSRTFSAFWNFRISDIYGFGARLNAGVSRYEYAGEGWSHHLTSFSGSMNIWWNKGPVTISYYRKFPGKYLYGHVVGKEENSDALSVEVAPDKHWNIGVDWMYMFDRKGTRYPSWSYSTVNPRTSERHISNNGNMVVVNVTYTADFGSIFRTARRRLNNSDNASSILKL